MMKNNPEKNIPSIQINVQTATEIAAIIEQIDNKIIQLLNCSSEDFLNLNAYLKEYHTKVNTLADSIEYVLNQLSDKKFQESVQTLEKKFIRLQGHLDKYVAATNHKSTKELMSRLQQLNVPFQNIRQDFKSLKLVLTNYNLEFKNQPQMANDIKTSLDKINNLFQKLDSHNETFTKLIDKGKSLFTDELLKNAIKIERLLNDFFLKMNSLFTQVEQHLRSLKNHTSRNDLHISNIITNLQYQDIVRQKIEHIQEIHKEIFAELSSMVDIPEQQLKNKFDFFIKIRDISGLQAAQLIHTNHEYQKAIKTITSNISELEVNLDLIHAICNNEDGSCYQKINQAIDSMRQAMEMIVHIKDPGEAIQEFDDECKNLEYMEEIIADAKNIIDSCNSKFENIIINQKELKSITENLYTALIESEETIAIFNADMQLLTSPIKSEIEPLKTILYEEFKKESKQLAETIDEIHDDISEKMNQEKNIFFSNNNDSKTTKKIKYYDLFETVIEEIIDHLNTINLKLENGEKGSLDKNKNLEYLKNKYTTESEHFIHDKIVNNQNFIEMEAGNNEDIDDDNLELF